MKTLLIILLLSASLFSQEKGKLLLESIAQYSIRIGDGNLSHEYTFVDPMCIHSKRYIRLIMEEKSLQKKNSYFIFLYRLDKYDSDELIQYIYEAKDTKLALKEVMVEEEDIDLFDVEASEKTLERIDKIAAVGKRLKVENRPQMFTFYNRQKHND